MKIYICANGYTDYQVKQAIECANKLTLLNHECSVNENPKLSYNLFPASEADLIVSLGGDGALLRASKIALNENKPLLGINSGRLGYLCAMSLDEVDNFDETLNKCKIKERTILQLEYNQKKYQTLNDVIVAKPDFGRTVDLTVNVENKTLMKVRGDGLIISTPTGSTAYNFSAGGPILDNDSKVLSITPICPHDKSGYPCVINDNKEIKIIVNHDDALIYVDGELIGKTKDMIVVNKAIDKLKLYTKE